MQQCVGDLRRDGGTGRRERFLVAGGHVVFGNGGWEAPGGVGAGFGPAFMGAYRTLVVLAAPDDRAGLIAAIFTVGYLAFSVPALIAGAATSRYGLHNTALVYSVAIVVLVAVAAASLLFRRGGPAGRPELAAAHPDPPPGPCTVPPCSRPDRACSLAPYRRRQGGGVVSQEA